MASDRVEELPDDFDEKMNMNQPPLSGPGPTLPNGAPMPSLEDMLSGHMPFPQKQGGNSNTNPNEAGAQMPPQMENVRQYTADELIAEMNRTPLFMTNLDDAEDNPQLEALKALAYEGTRAEIAGNFREQGNDMAKVKRWTDAREYYDKAITSLKMTDEQLIRAKGGEGPTELETVVVDQEEEEKKEKAILEASYTNRALCNLELKNYGSCNRDCGAAINLNPKNVKAWYRSASACLALDKLPEAEDAARRGLLVDQNNAALKTVSEKILKRKTYLEKMAKERQEREDRKRQEETTLKIALKARNIPIRTTKAAVDMEDAAISLENPIDPASTLNVPVLFLYPVHMQSDLIKQFREDESVGQHLTYIMPLPWDEKQEYTPAGVECYVETVSGGLIKAGKKLALLRLLNSGKVEIVDGLLKINVLPKDKVATWIEKFKAGRGG
ncbi:hypothetical protein MBLNU457_7436t1 [Dothideomycetes sp. NU457]